MTPGRSAAPSARTSHECVHVGHVFFTSGEDGPAMGLVTRA